jgi:nucleotidyltransferase substrate binding protein (TIGR01987 family)
MIYMTNYYGLKKKDFYNIIKIFNTYSKDIASVILFGSRSRGDAKKTSDIDLAIKFRHNSNLLVKITEEIDLLDIIYTVDMINYDTIDNGKLKDYINSEGKVIYLTNDKGEPILNTNKIIDKHIDLKKALNKLEESAIRNPHSDDIILDATIKRFEFTYELSWKLMKTILEYNGNNNGTSPRSSIREAFKTGLITDGDTWIKMLGDRNRTSHTYDEDCAYEIFDNIKSLYIPAFNDFVDSVENEIKSL